MQPLVWLRTLGELRLENPDGEVRRLRRKDRVLLTWLARHDGVARRAELAALLWSDRDEARARHSLRQALFSLQRAVPDVLEVAAERVRLRPGTLELDVNALEDDAQAGRLTSAFARWRGDFLEGLEDTGSESLRTWVLAERAGLRSLLERTLAGLLEEARSTGSWGDAQEAAHRWVAAHPWDEKAHAALIEVLRGAGRLEAAVERHAHSLTQLREELGVEPSAAFLRLGRELATSRLPAPVRPAQESTSVMSNEALDALRQAWRSGGGVAYVECDDAAEAARLCSDFVASIPEAAAPVLVLRASAAEKAAPTPWETAARLLAPIRTAPGLSGVDDDILAELTRLVPSIRERFPRLPPPRGGDSRLEAAAVRSLADVAAEIPIAIVVEWLGDADAATRRLLERLATELPASVLLVVTGRTRGDSVIARTRGCIHLKLAAPAAAQDDSAVPVAALPTRRDRRSLAFGLAGIGFVAVLLAAIARRAEPAAPLMVVGEFTALNVAAENPVARALPELLTSQLARTERLDVLSRARMQELRARSESELAAARAARAGVLLDGELHGERGGYRLDVRHIDVRTGRVLRTHTVRAADAAQLVHEAAVAVARSHNLEPPPAADHIRSVVARAFYEEGLSAVYRDGDMRRAFAHFTKALGEDSTFAMAAFYASASATWVDSVTKYHRLAARVVDAAPDRDRLRILASLLWYRSDPRALAVAETLAIRYPYDPAGAIQLGQAREMSGDFPGAIEQFQRALAFDPELRGASSGICHACDAQWLIVHAYWAADSLPAALRYAHRAVELLPQRATAWSILAGVLDAAGRHEEAAAARQKTAALGRPEILDAVPEVQGFLRNGDFAAADRLLEQAVKGADPAVVKRAAWWQVVSFRYQGRVAEARRAAARVRELEQAVQPWYEAIPWAIVLEESGRPADASAVWDSIVAMVPDLHSPTRNARYQAWYRTHGGSAAAAASDTIRLALLIDTVQLIGSRSGYGRDQRLHHHLRGLLLRARGDLEGAEREFRAAIYSTTIGYTRTNLELARLLVDARRPHVAVPLLQAALRGGLEGSSLYVSRTDLHEMLGRAWDQAGRRDSAAVHYESVLRAWQNADSLLHPRREIVRQRLAAVRAQKIAQRRN